VASKTIVAVLEKAGKAILHRLGEEQTEKILDGDCITSWFKVQFSELNYVIYLFKRGITSCMWLTENSELI
jgi:hypothetical protein